MAAQIPSFYFRIDSIRQKVHTPPQVFMNGFYKPPIKPDHVETPTSTGWRRWTVNGISDQVPPPACTYMYSTSVFYDGITKRFMFFPGDCRTTNISAIEAAEGEKWGWQQLRFSEKSPNHTVLDHGGEYHDLHGLPGSYSPELLPACYASMEHDAQKCGLSGNMSLLMALTAFSCRPERMLAAIVGRLRLGERRWDNMNNVDWGTSRIHGRGFVVHIRANADLQRWEEGENGPLLR